jgi:hypothetical protein
LGDKETLSSTILEVTCIDSRVLRDPERLPQCSVAARMSWAANRHTTRREDTAYCLLGIFGIRIPLIYGEGNDAFIRLQEEIIKVIDDESILLWDYDAGRQDFVNTLAPSQSLGVLAKHPSYFRSKGCVERLGPSSEPWRMTPLGLQIPSSRWIYRRPGAWDLELACLERKHGEVMYFGIPLSRNEFQDSFGRRHEPLTAFRFDAPVTRTSVSGIYLSKGDERLDSVQDLSHPQFLAILGAIRLDRHPIAQAKEECALVLRSICKFDIHGRCHEVSPTTLINLTQEEDIFVLRYLPDSATYSYGIEKGIDFVVISRFQGRKWTLMSRLFLLKPVQTRDQARGLRLQPEYAINKYNGLNWEQVMTSLDTSTTLSFSSTGGSRYFEVKAALDSNSNSGSILKLYIDWKVETAQQVPTRKSGNKCKIFTCVAISLIFLGVVVAIAIIAAFSSALTTRRQ